ncbi:MAG: YtxH domain-containing protein [Nitrospirales bacterium]|nr:YtxH domain-containing protein [Nitrospirales bacterium]
MSHYETDAAAGKMVGILVTGIVIGTVATFLLSPQSGRESRDQIRQYVRRKGEGLEEGLHDLQEKTVETYHDMASETRQGLEEIRRTVKEALQAGLDEFRKEWKQVRHTS